MPVMFRLLLAFLPFFWMADPPGGGDPKDPPADPKDPPADPPKKIEWTPEQQAEINRIAAKEAKQAADKARTDLEAKQAADKAAADAEAKRKADENRGAFDEVKASLTKERDDVTGERDGLKSERDALAAYVTADIEAVTKAVKDAKDSQAAKVHLRYYPGDDADPLALLKWAQEAKEDLPEITNTKSPRGNGANPAPGGDTKVNETQEVARARSNIRI